MCIKQALQQDITTRNARQSLSYSPLGIVASEQVVAKHKVLPPGERRYTYSIADRRLFYTVKLWKCWSEAHKIYIRCSLIIAAVNAHIQINARNIALPASLLTGIKNISAIADVHDVRVTLHTKLEKASKGQHTFRLVPQGRTLASTCSSMHNRAATRRTQSYLSDP